MSQYPDEIFEPRTMQNIDGVLYDPSRTKDIFAEDFNYERSEIVAIENELGTNAKGAFSSVKDWLLNLSALIAGIFSSATLNLYVDTTNGTDADGQGYGTGANATKTIQYAIGLIPPLNGGNVNVYVASGVYRETVTIRAKGYTGPYTINIIGEKEYTATGTATSGSGTTLSTNLNLTLNQYAGKLLRITGGTGSGQKAIILSNTAGPNSVFTVEYFATAPDSTTTYRVETNLCRVTGANSGADTTSVRANSFIIQDQRSCNLTGFLCDYCTGYAIVYNTASGNASENEIKNNNGGGVQGLNFSPASFTYSYIHNNTGHGISYVARAAGNATGNWIYQNTAIGVSLQDSFSYTVRNRIESNGTHGCEAIQCSTIQNAGNSTIKNNGGWGQRVHAKSYAVNASTNIYSGNANGTFYQAESLYNTAGALRQFNAHQVEGSVALVAGVAVVTLTAPAIFSSATSYTVLLSRSINTSIIDVVNNSASQFTITSANALDTDIVRFVAIGD